MVESCLRRGFAPDIFHCHDWHTGFLPLFLKTLYAPVPLFANSKSVLTIHNIGYQGIISRDFIADLGLHGAEAQLDAADLQAGFINSLKTGIKFAHTVTTVSPTYAREITETSLGMGMEDTLRASIIGNGIRGTISTSRRISRPSISRASAPTSSSSWRRAASTDHPIVR